MIAVVLAGTLALAQPVLKCRGADIAVTHLRMRLLRAEKTGTLDRVLISADVANVGSRAQSPHTAQRAELIHDGEVIGSQKFPALAAGVTYPLQFRIFREPAQRRDPLEVLVRYVLDDKRHAISANCSTANDSLQKLF